MRYYSSYDGRQITEYVKMWEDHYQMEVPLEKNGRHMTIHHINGDHSDNRIENLQMIPHAEHMSHHKTGFKHADETKNKIREKVKGLIKSEETIKKISEVCKGKHKSEEHKNKISEIRHGRKWSEEIKKKMSESHKKCWSIRKAQMSEAKSKIIPNSNEE